jgi:hypothetical protein
VAWKRWVTPGALFRKRPLNTVRPCGLTRRGRTVNVTPALTLKVSVEVADDEAPRQEETELARRRYDKTNGTGLVEAVKAATTAGSNWVPAQRWSSASASAWEIAAR